MTRLVQASVVREILDVAFFSVFLSFSTEVSYFLSKNQK